MWSCRWTMVESLEGEYRSRGLRAHTVDLPWLLSNNRKAVYVITSLEV